MVTKVPLSMQEYRGKNLIIDGGFKFWFEGTSQTATGYGSDTMHRNVHSGSTKTHTRESFALGQTEVPGNPEFYSRTVVTSVAGVANYCLKETAIEDVRTFAGRVVTVSFYAKADAVKNIAFDMYQDFGTGGAPSAAVQGIGVTLIELTTNWQRVSITTLVPSTAGKTLGTANDSSTKLRVWFDAGDDYAAESSALGQQSGTFDIANVQLELGNTATDFEQRTKGEELALVERHYKLIAWPAAHAVSVGQALTSVAASWMLEGLGAPMRAMPSASIPLNALQALNASGGAAGGAVSIVTVIKDGTSIKLSTSNATGLVSGNASQLFSTTASSIELDARL